MTYLGAVRDHEVPLYWHMHIHYSIHTLRQGKVQELSVDNAITTQLVYPENITNKVHEQSEQMT
jgi:hypothetical protein